MALHSHLPSGLDGGVLPPPPMHDRPRRGPGSWFAPSTSLSQPAVPTPKPSLHHSSNIGHTRSSKAFAEGHNPSSKGDEASGGLNSRVSSTLDMQRSTMSSLAMDPYVAPSPKVIAPQDSISELDPIPSINRPASTAHRQCKALTIGVPKETMANERRVALTPNGVRSLVTAGLTVFIECGAGALSQYNDASYTSAGAVVTDRQQVLQSDLLAVVRPPDRHHPFTGSATIPLTQQCISLRGTHSLLGESISLAAARPTLVTALDRIAGERAVQMAVTHYSLATRGSVPSRMVIIGATAMGLRAAEAARNFRMRVVVLDLDGSHEAAVRAAGALPVMPNLSGGVRQWRASVISYCRTADVLFATATPMGGPLDREMVRQVRAPAVYIDPVGALEVTQPERVITYYNVTCVGYTDLAGLDTNAASAVYSQWMVDYIMAFAAGTEPVASADTQTFSSFDTATSQTKRQGRRSKLQVPQPTSPISPSAMLLMGGVFLFSAVPYSPVLFCSLPPKVVGAGVLLSGWYLRSQTQWTESNHAGRPLWTFLPVGFVSGLVGWMYISYADMVGFGSTAEILVFHIPFGLGIWSLAQAVSTHPGGVPAEWHAASPADVPAHIRRGGREVKSSGKARYCRRCRCFKPDRTHHDSNMDQCVLRMDHHCPWINNTVGHHNHKFFLLFVAYMVVSSFYICTTAFPTSHAILSYLFRPSGPPQFLQIARAVNWLCAHFTSGLFAGSLTPFLYFHLRLVSENMTTIEFLEKRDQLRAYADNQRHLYDVGLKENFIALFGPKWYLWWVPVATSQGNGVYFPTVLDTD